MLEGTHVPLEADCTDEGWNGFHVPILTPRELNAYLMACQRNDPNGEYAERAWEGYGADWRSVLRLPSWQDPTDRDLDDVWAWTGVRDDGSATYLIDGWVWVDYVSHDDA